MYNILTLDKISESGLSLLSNSEFTISKDEKNPEGILLRSFNMHDMELPKTLKAVARAGAGVNNIPIDKCSENGIVVFNTPGANANAVKELVVAALMLSSRNIVGGINWVQSLKDEKDVAKLVEKGKSAYVGPEIMGKKIGVIGLGAIGVLVSNVCKSLGMDVYGYDPFLSVDAAWALSRGVHKASSYEELFASCDYLSIHVPLNAETKHMINADSISKMKKGVRILNMARAELVDNESIKNAVKDGTVGCYVTDFPTEEVLNVENIITIPHLGASTPESEDNCAAMAANQLSEFLKYGNIVNSVNLPNCGMPYTGLKRVCVIHKNVPNVIGSITSGIAGINLNIENMINRSKGDYAYTMIDISQNNSESIEEKLLCLDEIISVRVI